MSKAGKVFRAAIRAAHPSVAAVLAADRLGRAQPVSSRQKHLRAAVEWLCRAQDVTGTSGGVSAGFSIAHGWLPPYPETTGYIIPSLLDVDTQFPDLALRRRARQMADWEIEVQLPNGGVQGGQFRPAQEVRKPVVFNTGQVILGWCRAFREFGDERYRTAANSAAEWLLSVQSPNGAWCLEGTETETAVHAYDARTAWSLLEVDAISPDPRYVAAANRQLEWVLGLQRGNGWFAENAFFGAGAWNLTFTHTIAYVMEGLQEAHRLTQVTTYFDALYRTADKLLRIFELRRYMAGDFDDRWTSSSRYGCLTGNAQIAAVWMRLFVSTGDIRFLNGALKLTDTVKRSQHLSSLHSGIRGGVKGSQPISGRYTPYTYINWGAKFFIDALVLESHCLELVAKAIDAGAPIGGALQTR
jgi:hypothetical protein